MSYNDWDEQRREEERRLRAEREKSQKEEWKRREKEDEEFREWRREERERRKEARSEHLERLRKKKIKAQQKKEQQKSQTDIELSPEEIERLKQTLKEENILIKILCAPISAVKAIFKAILYVISKIVYGLMYLGIRNICIIICVLIVAAFVFGIASGKIGKDSVEKQSLPETAEYIAFNTTYETNLLKYKDTAKDSDDNYTPFKIKLDKPGTLTVHTKCRKKTYQRIRKDEKKLFGDEFLVELPDGGGSLVHPVEADVVLILDKGEYLYEVATFGPLDIFQRKLEITFKFEENDFTLETEDNDSAEQSNQIKLKSKTAGKITPEKYWNDRRDFYELNIGKNGKYIIDYLLYMNTSVYPWKTYGEQYNVLTVNIYTSKDKEKPVYTFEYNPQKSDDLPSKYNEVLELKKGTYYIELCTEESTRYNYIGYIFSVSQN